MSPEVDSVLRQLKNGMLMGVRGKNNQVKCIFKNKNATNLRAVLETDNVYIKWSKEEVEFERKLEGLFEKGNIHMIIGQ